MPKCPQCGKPIVGKLLLRTGVECPSCHVELQETPGTIAISISVFLVTFLLLSALLEARTPVYIVSFGIMTATRLLFGRLKVRFRIPSLLGPNSH